MRTITAGIMGAVLMTAVTAHAEHKLLVTDLLDKGQVEASATYEYSRIQQSFHDAVENGRRVQYTSESFYSLGVGLGYGLEMHASVPYVFSEREKEENIATPSDRKREGFGDFRLGVTYSLLDAKTKPVAVVVGADVKFDTAGGNAPGTGTTDWSPYLYASKKYGHHFTPYAGYRAVIRNNEAMDSHILTLGSELELNETVTFDVRFDASLNSATTAISSNETYSVELASYLQLYHNLYLIPAVGVAAGSSYHAKSVDVSFGSPVGMMGALSLYYLY